MLVLQIVTSGNEGRREGREMAVVTTAFGLVNWIAWLQPIAHHITRLYTL